MSETKDSDLWCKICGELMIFPRSHRCPPYWYIEYGDYDYTGDEMYKVRCKDAQTAAEKFAETMDCEGGDYEIVGGTPIEVTVYDENKKNPVKFEITGEPVPTYYAQEI